MKHLRYLRYVLLHKLYVYRAGRKLHVSRLQLLCHDFQKFMPIEWFPYADFFYGTKDQEAFDRAWLHHQKLGGKHHWQYWVLNKDEDAQKLIKIPERYAREMIADWSGAGLAITGEENPRDWYFAEKAKGKILLHPQTRILVEELINETWN